jgi:hypothetical protein
LPFWDGPGAGNSKLSDWHAEALLWAMWTPDGCALVLRKRFERQMTPKLVVIVAQ